MILRIIAGILGALAGIGSMGTLIANRIGLSVLFALLATLLMRLAQIRLPKGENWRRVPRDDHFDR